jgi:chemotaxis signal transduction protein
MNYVPWLRFEVATRQFALPIEVVAEVTHAQRPKLIPRVSMDMAGVVNFRGEPLPVIDGGALLLGHASVGHRHLVVLRGSALQVGMLVTRVVRIERRMRQAVPMDEPPAEPAFTDWVLLAGQQIGLLEAGGLMDRARELLMEQPLNTGGMPCQSAF